MSRLLARPLEIALLLLLGGVCAIRNVPWNVDDYDQAKQAFVSLEIVETGAWWFQHTPSDRIATKPPLAGWISAGLQPLVGWDLAWRLPSFLAAGLIGWVLWRSGGRVLPGAGGMLAVSAFGFTLLTPRLATLVRTDMLLALWIFLAGWMVWDRLETGRPWTARSRWALALVVAAALMTKGPILYAFLVPALCAWPLLRRAGWVRDRLGVGWWPWGIGLVFFLAWAGVGVMTDPAFKLQVVDREFLGRFTTGEQAVHKSQPPWFYVVHLLHKLAPWSLLAAWLGWSVSRARPGVPGPRDSDKWLVVWLLGGLVVMSCIPSKRVDRVFALVPVLALLIPALLRALGGWAPVRRPLQIVLALAVLAASGYAVARPVAALREDEGALARWSAEVRAAADANRWRLGVVRSPREGVTVYLRDARPLTLGQAEAAWRRGELEALVLLESDHARGDWGGVGSVRGRVSIPDRKGDTILVTRNGPAPIAK